MWPDRPGSSRSRLPGRVAEARDHEWVAAGQADVRAELGVDDLDPAAGRAKGGGGDLGPGRTEQSLALSVRDRAADHDPAGVQRVDEADAGDCECASAALHDFAAGLVAGVLALRDVPSLDGVDALLRGPLAQERAAPGERRRAGRLGHGRAAEERLEVADAAAAAHALHRDGRVAELARGAVRAVEDPAVGDDGSADAGRDGEVDEVRAVAGRPEGHLAEGGDVGVPLQEGRQAEARSQLRRRSGTSTKSGPMLGVCDHHAAPRVHRTRAGDADSRDRVADFAGTPSRALLQRRLAGIQDRRGAVRDGVRPRATASREPSSMTTAARMWVPPTSSARTGRADRGKPRDWDLVGMRANSSKGDSGPSGPVGPFGLFPPTACGSPRLPLQPCRAYRSRARQAPEMARPPPSGGRCLSNR